MNKQELINKKVQQGVAKKVVEKDFAKFEEQFKAMGFKGKELEERTVRKMVSYYTLQEKTLGVETEAIFIGFKDNDFGTTNLYSRAIEMFRTNPEQAVADGLTNSNGQPLYNSRYDKGKIIELDDLFIRNYYGFIKTANGVVKGSLNGKVKFFKDNNLKPELFKSVKFKANKSDVKSTEKYLHFNLGIASTVETVGKLTAVEVNELLTKHYSDEIIKITELKQYVKNNIGNFDKFCIVKGDVFKIIESTGTKLEKRTNAEIQKQGVLGINDVDGNALTCYVNPDLDMNFSEITQDLIIIGSPSINKEEEVNFTIHGFFCDEKYLVEKKPFVVADTVSDDEAEEEIIDKKKKW